MSPFKQRKQCLASWKMTTESYGDQIPGSISDIEPPVTNNDEENKPTMKVENGVVLQEEEDVKIGDWNKKNPFLNCIIFSNLFLFFFFILGGLFAHFGKTPVKLTCHNCEEEITTKLEKKIGTCQWGLAGLISLASCLVCFPCAMITFCVDDFKDVKHSCPKCNIVLEEHEYYSDDKSDKPLYRKGFYGHW